MGGSNVDDVEKTRVNPGFALPDIEDSSAEDSSLQRVFQGGLVDHRSTSRINQELLRFETVENAFLNHVPCRILSSAGERHVKTQDVFIKNVFEKEVAWVPSALSQGWVTKVDRHPQGPGFGRHSTAYASRPDDRNRLVSQAEFPGLAQD